VYGLGNQAFAGVVKEGEMVKFLEADKQGSVRLSMKEVGEDD